MEHTRWQAVPVSCRVGPALAAFALTVAVLQHLGAVPVEVLGEVGPTRWTDWLDLLTPYAVVGTALVTLLAARPDRTTWALAAVGAVLYVQGHGIHLAANSVSNRLEDDAVHLWDEVVGHLVWYAGLALLVVALVRAVRDRPLRTGPLALALAAAFGITHATNGLEGGTAPLSLAYALALCLWATRLPVPVRRLLLVAYAPAALVLAAWGLRHGGFPQPSEL
jgi:hypothetical protein